MTADLVAFLRARLDEDEQVAREAHAADPGPWHEDVEYDDFTNQRDGYGSGLVRADDNVALWDREQSCTLSMTAPTAVHVARHNPARVLAEVDAKREVVRLAERAHDYGPTFVSGFAAAMEGALRLFAVTYAEHPDYREEWRP